VPTEKELYEFLCEQQGGQKEVTKIFLLHQVRDFVNNGCSLGELVEFVEKHLPPELLQELTVDMLVLDDGENPQCIAHNKISLDEEMEEVDGEDADDWTPNPKTLIGKVFLAIQEDPSISRAAIAKQVYKKSDHKTRARVNTQIYELRKKGWVWAIDGCDEWGVRDDDITAPKKGSKKARRRAHLDLLGSGL
jgi:hypothetical protein